MIPFNTMANLDFCYQSIEPFVVQTYVLPKGSVVPTHLETDICLKRSILNLVTIPKLRAAFIFKIGLDQTEWIVFEPANDPLSLFEVRGSFILTIQELKQGIPLTLKKIKPSSKSFIQKTKPIIKEIEKIDPSDSFFVVLVFNGVLFAIGNVYDESLLCQAIVNFQQRKIKGYKQKEELNLLEKRKRSSLCIPKAVYFKGDSYYEHLVQQ